MQLQGERATAEYEGSSMNAADAPDRKARIDEGCHGVEIRSQRKQLRKPLPQRSTGERLDPRAAAILRITDPVALAAHPAHRGAGAGATRKRAGSEFEARSERDRLSLEPAAGTRSIRRLDPLREPFTALGLDPHAPYRNADPERETRIDPRQRAGVCERTGARPERDPGRCGLGRGCSRGLA